MIHMALMVIVIGVMVGIWIQWQRHGDEWWMAREPTQEHLCSKEGK
jgi:hypothetical protein